MSDPIIEASSNALKIVRSGGQIYIVERGTGADGTIGPAGAPGAPGQGFTLRGPWNSSSTYNPFDVVRNPTSVGGDGASYCCLTTNINQQPAGDDAYWMELAEAGAAGADGLDGATTTVTVTDDDGTWDIGWVNGGWQSGNHYKKGNMLRYVGSTISGSWVCVVENDATPDATPDVSSDWRLMAKDGKDGTNGSSSSSPSSSTIDGILNIDFDGDGSARFRNPSTEGGSITISAVDESDGGADAGSYTYSQDLPATLAPGATLVITRTGGSGLVAWAAKLSEAS
jgi:hypothetical protein